MIDDLFKTGKDDPERIPSGCSEVQAIAKRMRGYFFFTLSQMFVQLKSEKQITLFLFHGNACCAGYFVHVQKTKRRA